MRDACWSNARSGAFMILCLATVLALCVPMKSAFAGHKLDAPGTSCNTCHSVGGASDAVVANTRLIKKDARILEILNGGWSTGQPLPCIYCHDSASQSVRTNMAGVANHFSDFSLSKHPVDGNLSNNTNGAGLDCVDCHTNVAYVGGGNSLSPNIHNLDVSAQTWTGAGLIDAPDTFVNYSTAASVSILNSEGNSFCTRQCHDASHTGYAAQGIFHGYSNAIVTLDDIDAGGTPTAPTGCINTAGNTDGCHDIHHSDNNIGLVTLEKTGGSNVNRSDCGICHEFDDQGAASDWSQSGHGMFSTTNNIQCLSCHDGSGPHFDQTGSTPSSNPSLLSFTVDYGEVSSLTGLPVYANCVTSNCHAGYSAHSTMNVGCIDCHEVHGEGVSPNIKMMRRTIPGGSQVMQYTAAGQQFDSSVAPGVYSNWLCDNQDCHSGPSGPGPISSLMDTATGTHTGGTGIMGNCDACHQHRPASGGGGPSWSGGECFDCHGTAGSNFYPDGAVYPDRIGKHATHIAAIANANSLASTNNQTCDWCHPGGGHSGGHEPAPADLHNGSGNFKDITGSLDAGSQASQNGTNDQVSCSNIACHYNNTMASTDWYGSPAVGCDYCHAYDSAYDSGDLPLAHDIHVDEAASGGYDFTCVICHDSDGYTNSHQDGNSGSSIAFTLVAATWSGAAYDSGTMQCANLYCHGSAPPQAADFDNAGSVSCGTCHGDGTGRPTSPPTGGSHQSGSGVTSHSQVSCGTCHPHNGGPAAGEHVNGPANVSGDALVSTAGSEITAAAYGSHLGTDADGYEYSQNSCTPTCHQQLTWADTGSCDTCHVVTGTTAETNDWAWNGTTATINLDEYNNTGHGSTLGGAVGGTPVECLDCHSESVPHNSAANPFRLDTSTYAANDINGFCGDTSTGCHANFSTIQNHDSTVITNDQRTWHFTPKCVDCHDPHGDNNNRSTSGGTYNAKFMHDDLFDGGSDQYGVPATQDTDYAGFDGTEAIGADNWAEGAGDGRDGLCQECHVNTVAFQDNTTDNSAPHSASSGCVSCHPHDAGFEAGGCDGCHGTVGNNFYPDSTPADTYEDREGAHYEHVIAIASANAGVESNDGSTCVWCHPAPGASRPGTGELSHDTDSAPTGIADVHGDSRGGATATYFQTMAGASDTDATYDNGTQVCSNVNCHGNNDTPDWYNVPPPPDTAGPVFTPNGNVSASTSAALSAYVSWNPAVDAYPSNPVRYDLYWSTDGTPLTAPAGTMTGIAGTGATVVFASSATSLEFQVVAKDSASNSTNSNVSNSVNISPAPSGGSPTAHTFHGNPALGGINFGGGQSSTIDVCGGTTNTFGDWAKLTRDGGYECGTTNTYVETTTTYATSTGHWITFVSDHVYTQDTTIEPVFQSGVSHFTRNRADTTNGVYVDIQIGEYNTSNGTFNGFGTALNTAIPGPTQANATYDLTSQTGTVRNGNRLALRYVITTNDADPNERIFFGSSSNKFEVFTVNETPGPADDTTAPVWSGGVSGIAVSNVATGGELQISWNTATDAQTPPVTYWLYRNTGTNDPFGAPDATWPRQVGTNSYVDSGLVNGTTYYYGIRAENNDTVSKDRTTNNDTASGSPTAGTGGAFDCNSCHASPPDSGGGAGSHLAHANGDTDYTECDSCHPGASVYTNSHQDGLGQLAFDGTAVNGQTAGNRLFYVDNAITIYDDTDGYGVLNATAGDGIDDGTCASTSCHGSGTPQWGNPASVLCGSCHGKEVGTEDRSAYADTGDSVQGAPPFDLAGGTSATLVGKHLNHVNVSWSLTGSSCDLCHDGAGKGTAAHADFTASGNGTNADVAFHTSAGGSASYAGNTCSNLAAGSCHGSTTWNTATTLNCTACHTGITTHLKLTRGGADQACEACHPGGSSYPIRHSDNSNPEVVFIPNYSNVGINNAYGGVHLGGDSTDAYNLTTEAEICWRCHDANNNNSLNDANDISEWGTNISNVTGSITYNYGTLNQRSWIGGTWTSGTGAFSYKSALINPDTLANQDRGSIHTANPSGAPWNGPTANYGDAVGQIRCSYCHDVHNTMGPDGEPYLRGNWQGNPYNEDGAPRQGTNYTSQTVWGPVPRGGYNSTDTGGYFIDQNSGNPASAWATSTFAGLCDLCHGQTIDGNMTAAEIDSLNVFGTEGGDWISGRNGHVNSVKGASHNDTNSARNIFAGRGGALNQTRQDTDDHPYMMFDGSDVPGDDAGGFRVQTESAWSYTPYMAGYSGDGPKDGSSWNNAAKWNNLSALDMRGSTVNAGYHNFPCSKCHNPHASRLPRLMITNCLDTKHNEWDNNYQVHGTTDSVNSSRSISNWSSAQNCHRLRGNDLSDTRDTAAPDLPGNRGWNTVTPW